MKYILAVGFSLFLVSPSYAQWFAWGKLPEPGTPSTEIEPVLKGHYLFSDTTYHDMKNAEGKLMVHAIRYFPIDPYGMGMPGVLEVKYDEFGLIYYATWKAGAPLDVFGDLPTVSDPNGSLKPLWAVNSEFTRKSLDSLAQKVTKLWGKPTIRSTTQKVVYEYRSKYAYRQVFLSEGMLACGWVMQHAPHY